MADGLSSVLLFGVPDKVNIPANYSCDQNEPPIFTISGGKEGGWDSRGEGGKSCHGGGEEKNTFMWEI